LIENKELTFQFGFQHIPSNSGTAGFLVGRFTRSCGVGLSDGNSIAALTVERVELLKTIVAVVARRHSS